MIEEIQNTRAKKAAGIFIHNLFQFSAILKCAAHFFTKFQIVMVNRIVNDGFQFGGIDLAVFVKHAFISAASS